MCFYSIRQACLQEDNNTQIQIDYTFNDESADNLTASLSDNYYKR